MALLFDDDDFPAALMQQRSDGRARGPATEHENVALGARGCFSGGCVGHLVVIILERDRTVFHLRFVVTRRHLPRGGLSVL